MKLAKKFMISLTIVFILINTRTLAADLNRVYGENRYETAVRFSEKIFKESDSIILASGEVFPDAICAAQFARIIDAPILLTKKYEMPDSVLKEIRRLNSKKIYIIGGENSVDSNQVEAIKLDYERIYGKTRYETSERIIEEIADRGVKTSEIVVVSGEKFQNIINANQFAISNEMPVLLVHKKIPMKYMNRNFYQIGDISFEIDALKIIDGLDYFEISKKCLETTDDFSELNIVSGENFPDAIVAAAQSKNILLTKENALNEYAIDLISSGVFETINIIGGNNSISDSVADQLFGIDEENIRNARLPMKLDSNHEGKIMALIYHDIDDYNDRYHRTPGAFKADIINLYNKGYLPISLKDYYTNNINIEEGYTPYIITLDDGTESKIKLDESGNLTGKCAFSILREMEEKLPNFKAKATFFVNREIPFGQDEFAAKKINMIIDAGMHIGNHTVNHVNLEKNPELIEKEIALQKKNLEKYMETDYIVDTFAIPYSIVFEDKSEYDRIREGEFEGIKYKNVLIAGGVARPAASPDIFDAKKHILPRIPVARTKVNGRGLYDYLDYFDKNPKERYVK
ncbi:MAG: cell wall-binding repeat-containing protein [Tissierellia bacterium]|nr:cell wall-binding repeat-containing protein [Tissierellia bacterium]